MTYDDNEPKFCIVGLKLHEMGVADGLLLGEECILNSSVGENKDILLACEPLYGLNDEAVSKEALIEALESETHRDQEFPLEKLAEILKHDRTPVCE